MSELNPTYELKIGNIKVKCYLSDIRTQFRNWLLGRNVIYFLPRQSNRQVVNDFLIAVMNAEIKSKDLTQLTTNLVGDITKRINGANKHSDFLLPMAHFIT